MKAILIKYVKVVEDKGNIIEVRLWKVHPVPDKPHGYKYSLVYVVNGNRVIGYDNAEGKGEHRHYRDKTEDYKFENLKKLTEDFYRDIDKYKKGEL